ncbi:hypothetical protein [Murimonas intestini]|uniref:hypothetical protein n=2 Tax=Murimonas intestini TaxID=1337051 RepID=UPI0011DD1B77|nr:hypothetical protein [Murimonas intestini]
MILYHGSNTSSLNTLKPQQADHDRPYIYMTTIKIVAGFYLINAVERPYYWFPYGFEKDGTVHYQEWYPNALKEAAEGKTGYIYTIDAKEEDVLPFKNIPCAKLGTAPMSVIDCITIPDCYQWLMEQEKSGAFILKKYKDKTPEQFKFLQRQLLDYLSEKNMKENPTCSYAKFVQAKFPAIWEEYIKRG